MNATPTLTVDTDKKCYRCSNPGATDNGLCLDCVTVSLNPQSSVAAKVPEHIKDQLIQYAEEGDEQWKNSARLLEQMFEDAAAEGIRLPKMKMYQDAAACAGQKTSTIRNWVLIRNKVGDELIDEYPIFRFSHWRAIVPAAKKAGKTIADFAGKLAESSDKYGGLPIPVDVIIARSEGKEEKSEAELFMDELDAARANVANMTRHVNAYSRSLRGDVLALASAVEDLAARVEAIEKRRAKEERGEVGKR